MSKKLSNKLSNKFLGTSILEVPGSKKICRNKNNRGISLMSMIITIIVIIIIAAIALIDGFSENLKEAEFSKIYNEFLEVEDAVAQRGYEHKLDSGVYPYLGKKFSETDKIVINNITFGAGYFLVTPDDFTELGIDSVVRSYVVNYETADVILVEPYYLSDIRVYTKEDMLDVYTQNGVIVAGEYDKLKGVNKPILMDGMLPIIYNGSSWVVASKDDQHWYDYSVTSSGPIRYANVMLLDDTTLRNSSGRLFTNEEIRGMNLENLIGMEVVTEGSIFVWIPRYTYKEEADGTTSIVYSNLTKDYTNDGYIKSPAFYFGEYTGADTTESTNSGYTAGGKELTGIWISKYQAGYMD